MFWLRGVPEIVDVVNVFVRSIAVLTANGKFFACATVAFSERYVPAFNPSEPTGYYMYHQFDTQKFCVLPKDCIYVFCVDLRNSDYFPIQRSLTGLYNRDGVFLLRGRVCVLICNANPVATARLLLHLPPPPI